jgi:isoleucyl-tRNA synthetase
MTAACSTPLSNFEAGQNYKEVSDPEVVVSFPLLADAFKGVHVLAWTTTPWTLPSNLALCVHPDMEYVVVKDAKTAALYLLATSRICQMYKKEGEYAVVSTHVGKDLAGLKYTPIFDYFAEAKAAVGFRILTDTYVTDGSGTGVVHQAPAFGEDDFRVCMAGGVIEKGESVPCPVDDDGRFTGVVRDFAGTHVKDADKAIIAHLKASGRLVKSGAVKHSYPFCWRSDTPLIYKAVPSWFVKVEAIQDRLVHNNSLTYWVPDFVKEKRFHNWLAGARDWAISRNRFWGTPLPIWRSDDWEEVVCVGSIAELEALSGVRVADLHKDSVDHITIPSKTGRGPLRRVEEVFDCWFESGSMPYAQASGVRG